MLAYIVMYVIVLIAFIYKKNRNIAEISFFVLLFFSLFRGDLVGIDTQGAMSWGQIVSRATVEFDWMNSRTYEISTNFIYKCIYNNNLPERTIIVFYSLITFLFLRLSSKRLNIDLATLMVVFLLGGAYIYSFNIARQYTGLAVIVYAITYIYEKDFKRSLLFFLFVLFAITIHTSSIIFMPLYLFRYIKAQKRFVYATILLFIFLYVIGIFDIRSLVSRSLSIDSMDAYSDQYMHELSAVGQKSLGGYIMMFAQLSVQLFMLNTLFNHYRYSVLFAFVILVGFLSNDISGDISRVFFGFRLLVMLFMGYYLSNSKNLYVRYFFIIIYSYSFFKGIMDPYYFCF